VGAGLAAALLATRWLAGFAEAQLFNVNTSDPTTLAAASMTVTVAAVIAPGCRPGARAESIRLWC
jgi:hypothetical protein